MKLIIVLALCSLAAAKPTWLTDKFYGVGSFEGDNVIVDDIFYKMGLKLYDLGVRFHILHRFEIFYSGIDHANIDYKFLGMKFYHFLDMKLGLMDYHLRMKIIGDKTLFFRYILDMFFTNDFLYKFDFTYFKDFWSIVDLFFTLKTKFITKYDSYGVSDHYGYGYFDSLYGDAGKFGQYDRFDYFDKPYKMNYFDKFYRMGDTGKHGVYDYGVYDHGVYDYHY